MRKIISTIIFLFVTATSPAQNIFHTKMIDEKTKEMLIGATAFIEQLNTGASTDSAGFLVIKNIPDGNFEITFRYIGYEEKKQSFKFPLTNPNQVFEIELESATKELSEVIVQTTRSSRSIENIPTRVEVIAADELEEEAAMKPGEIKKLLTETTGIATQQTSPVSGTVNIRIQGLDGRYTQLLRDGMPLYSGFAEGLSVMQIAPLDLKQVEFIKGSASTLYGGGAIAGLINLISKTPEEKPGLTFLLNGTTAKGFDGSLFYSVRGKKIGTTFLSAYNYNAPYDPARIGLTAIPMINRFTFNPKIFFYFNRKTSAWFGVNGTYEDRYGGDIQVIEGNADSVHQYFERNKTLRLSTQLSFTYQINEYSAIHFKNSFGSFERKLSQPGINFSGKQFSSFSEFNYTNTHKKLEWVAGMNEWTYDFDAHDSSNLYYHPITVGVFAQNTFNASKRFSLEIGLRIDYNTPSTNDNLEGVFILPRMSALFKFNQHFTSRIGGGMGYKMPSPFTTEAEQQGYKNIQSIALSNTHAEKSYGGNADVTFKTSINEVSVSINELLFYTYLNEPLVLEQDSFVNADGYIDTKGAETNLKIGWDNLSLYVGYTLADVRQHFNNQNVVQPLTPKHRLILDFTYEKEGDYRTGFEADYSSEQRLSDNTTGKAYVVFGFIFEKMWEHINAFVNAENFTDRRQTRWDTLYSGTITQPVFKEIYAPLDGIVVNMGVKIKL